MEFKTKRKDNSAVKITVKNTPEEVAEAYKAAYVQAAKKVKVPGFRKGKVPLDMVERQLGDSVAGDAVRHLISDTLKEIVDELDPPPINMPQFDVESFDREKGAVFTGTYDTHPETKLGKYKKLKVTEDSCKVGDDEVNERIEDLRKQHATIKTREEEEAAENDDIVRVELAIREGDSTLYDNKEQQFQVGAEEQIPGLNNHLLGLKTGEERVFETEFAEDFPGKEFAGKKVSVSLKVNEIQYPEYPAVDDDFAQDAGEYENLEQLRAGLLKELRDKGKEVLGKRAKDSLLEKVVKDAKFSIPESIIKQEIQRRTDMIKQRAGMQEGGIPELAQMMGRETEDLEKELREFSERGIKENLALLEISREEEVSVEEAEVEAEIKTRFGSMMTDQQLKDWMKQDSIIDNVKSNLLFHKTLDWLLENAEVKKGKDIPFSELKKAEDFS